MKKHFGMLLVCLAAWQSPIRATDYVFTRLFVGEWDSRSNQPTIPTYTIADSGTVVFQTVYSSAGGAWPGTGPATFTTYLARAGSTAKKVATEQGTSLFAASSVNSSGLIVGWRNSADGMDVVTLSDTGTFTKVVTSSGFLVGPSINDQGDIAYSTLTSVLKRTSKGTVSTLASATKGLLWVGHITANGAVPFVNDGYQSGGVYLARETGITKIFQSTTTLPNLVGTVPAANDSGDVAYLTTTTQLDFPNNAVLDGLYSGTGGAVALLRPAVLGASRCVSVSNTGAVLYRYSNLTFTDPRTPFRTGLYTGGDLNKDKVAEVGDALFGSILQDLGTHSYAGRRINNRGEVVFTYRLKSGEYGVGLATPVSAISSGAPALAIVNSANLSGGIAPNAIATIIGVDLASGTATASGAPQPSLGGTSVSITDSAGVTRPAPLFFVSKNQVNCLIPGGTATGYATVSISNGTVTTTGIANIAAVSPGIYALNGSGLVAANVLRVTNGAQSYETVYQVSGSNIEARPVDPGADGSDVYLLIYGTGFRAGTAPVVQVGGASVNVLYSGASGDVAGLDQLNVGPLPKALRGPQTILVNIQGSSANQTSILLQP